CVLSAGLLGTGLSTPVAASRGAAAGPEFALDDPCTYASRSVVKGAFRKSVTKATPSGTTLCYLSLGADPDVAPNGRLAVTQEFPGNRAFKTARGQFEDKRAIENLSAFEIADVFNLGRGAYSNQTTGALTVLANRKLSFTLSWIPAGRTQISPAEVKALERVARDLVARSRG
ncbi:MAG: hypothetical protein MUP97_00545, partial [Acidimicrobiia bacterium]|nr:hypothetical protein [Acidimicrobiia bacterium]